jgi:hypothetical protein
MGIKRRATHIRPFDNVIDRDRLVVFLSDQLNQCRAQQMTSSLTAAIILSLMQFLGVSAQSGFFVH